jgi:hypothetical protein
LLGVGFQNCEQANPEGQAYVLQQQPGESGSNPVLAGVTAKKGDSLGSTSVDVAPPSGSTPSVTYEADGWEVDQRGNGSPPHAYATDALIGLGGNASLSGEMLFFTTEMGGVVFAASSINFGGSMVVDPNMQRIVQNALDQCLAR